MESNTVQDAKEFVANTICLEGRWKSPGGKTKRVDDLNCDFVMTWYPGKLNTLLFSRKDDDFFKKLLVHECSEFGQY